MIKSLKILMILHVPWDRNLGASRVQLELAEEFEAMGHKVEKFDLFDAFPPKKITFADKLIRPNFSEKAKAFVQANSHRFDVIDAHQGNLPFTKQELGIKGLLVARSVGLYAFYEEFSQWEKTKWPPKRKRTKLKNLWYSLQSKEVNLQHFRSLQNCDLINVPNHDELAYVREILHFGAKCFAFPFGLSQARQKAFYQAAQPTAARLANQQVVFIGTWTPRKGARDWGEIIKRVKAQVPKVHFLFLGTGFSVEKVLSDLNLPVNDGIEILPQFNSEELPQLLSGATIGAFPSYIEGFGFAVLEKLASGLPTVAYDVPGPREMLHKLDDSLMIPVGDVQGFSDRLIQLLKLDLNTYAQISQRCVEVAQKFSWHKIAQETLDVYYRFLSKQN